MDYKHWLERLLWRVIDSALRKLDELSAPKISVQASFGSPQLKNPNNIMVQQRITNEQQLPFSLNFTTLGGQPALVDGPVQWEVLSGNSTLQEVSEDGKTGKLRSENGIGITRFKGTADADLGTGVVPISIEIELEVVGAQAASVGASFEPAEPKQPLP